MTDYVSRLAEAIRDRVPETLRPGSAHELRLFRAYAVLALAKGLETTAEDVHDAWVGWMGELDDAHEALRPYAELGQDERVQDEPFLHAIHDVCRLGFT